MNANDVTKTPSTKPALTEDGVATGMYITLASSVAMKNGAPAVIPPGTLISGPLSRGFDGTLNCNVERRKIGTDGDEIVYRL